jgi:arsenite methyltransferase
VNYLNPINVDTPELGDLFDELPLWSAPFGLWILDRVPLSPALTVLDIGAGTGFLSVELAERCGAGSTVIAVDPWATAAARLRRKIEQRQLTNVRLLEQDAATISLPDQSVNVIMSNLGVNNFDDPVAVMKVCSRAARPGAAFLLTTNLVGHMAEFYDVYRRVLTESGQGDRIAVLDAHIAQRATVDSVRTLLKDAGFEVVDVVTSSFRLRFADGSALLRHHFIRLGFLPSWIKVATPDRIFETFAQLDRALNSAAAANGELALTIPTAGFFARKRRK